MENSESEILNTQGRVILLDVYGQRQMQLCQNPDLLWGVPVVGGSKTQEERDGGKLCWRGNACEMSAKKFLSSSHSEIQRK